MEKKIVVIDVGSKTISSVGIDYISEVDIPEKTLQLNNGPLIYQFEYFLDIKQLQDGFFKSINGIPVNEIEEVRIAGYNDKVTLMVGDIFTHDKDMVSEKNMTITIFKNGEIIRNLCHMTPLLDFDYWYVNGKKYHRDNIIIPNQVVQPHDEINHVVQVNEMVEPSDYEEITKDNIVQVLDYNGISQDCFMIIRNDGNFITFGCGLDSEFGVETVDCRVNLDSSNWLQHTELEVGKLKPLPKFDFEDYIIDNTTVESRELLNDLAQDLYHGCRPKYIKLDKHNAEIVSKIYKLVDELK